MEKLKTFADLRWYDGLIRFIFNFTAKTSEVLLAAGLVVSTANFLTDGAIMSGHPVVATSWAWAQAIAIDSSLGVTFWYVFQCIKHQDWIKVVLYGLLTILLAVVAGTITNIDTFSHAQHLTIATATTEVGMPVWLLTLLRAIAVVGFILMSRLKDVSFTELYQSPSQVIQPQAVTQAATPTLEDIIETLDTRYEQKLEAVMERVTLTITQTVSEATQPQLPAIQVYQPATPVLSQQASSLIQQIDTPIDATVEQRIRTVLIDTPDISVRKLAERAGCAINTAQTWKKRILAETELKR
jgi:hypothetical protein